MLCDYTGNCVSRWYLVLVYKRLLWATLIPVLVLFSNSYPQRFAQNTKYFQWTTAKLCVVFDVHVTAHDENVQIGMVKFNWIRCWTDSMAHIVNRRENNWIIEKRKEEQKKKKTTSDSMSASNIIIMESCWMRFYEILLFDGTPNTTSWFVLFVISNEMNTKRIRR